MNEGNKMVTIDAYGAMESVGTMRTWNRVTVNLDQAALFRNKLTDGKMYYRILLGTEWFFISEETYQRCIKIMGPRDESGND